MILIPSEEEEKKKIRTMVSEVEQIVLQSLPAKNSTEFAVHHIQLSIIVVDDPQSKKKQLFSGINWRQELNENSIENTFYSAKFPTLIFNLRKTFKPFIWQKKTLKKGKKAMKGEQK